MTSTGNPKEGDLVETTIASRADDGSASVAKTDKKIATAKDQLGKEIVAPRLRNGLPIAIVNNKVITK